MKINWLSRVSTLLCLALVGMLISKLTTAQADTLIGTFTVNYRYNAAGQAVNQSNPDYTKANPCFGNTIPPGPIFVPNTTTPGQYRLVTVSGAGCGVWSGDCTGGTFWATGHGPGEEVTVSGTFGQLVLYYWDWIASDNDPGVQTTIEVYKVSQNRPPVAKCRDMTVAAGSDCSANASVDDGSFDPDGDPIIVVQLPAGPYAIGETAVTLTVTDSKGASNSCTATVTVKDAEAPVVTCVPATNPAGRNLPKAGNNPRRLNPSGFFQLIATDSCDPSPQIFIQDSASGFVAGPFTSGEEVKITQAAGATPNSKPMAGVIVAHIHLKGDALIYAVDEAGNKSDLHPCMVPPKSK